MASIADLEVSKVAGAETVKQRNADIATEVEVVMGILLLMNFAISADPSNASRWCCQDAPQMAGVPNVTCTQAH